MYVALAVPTGVIQEPWGTWLGSTGGMVAADAIAIAAGALMGARLPERAIKVFAAAAFVVFGVLLVSEGGVLWKRAVAPGR